MSSIENLFEKSISFAYLHGSPFNVYAYSFELQLLPRDFSIIAETIRYLATPQRSYYNLTPEHLLHYFQSRNHESLGLFGRSKVPCVSRNTLRLSNLPPGLPFSLFQFDFPLPVPRNHFPFSRIPFLRFLPFPTTSYRFSLAAVVLYASLYRWLYRGSSFQGAKTKRSSLTYYANRAAKRHRNAASRYTSRFLCYRSRNSGKNFK